jgi:hypothetical protein
VNADIARAWIAANLVASVVSGILAVLLYWVRSAIDPADAVRFVVDRGLLIAVTALQFAIYARLSGAVLGSIVPALSQRIWLRLHLFIGASAGTCLAFLTPGADSDSAPLELKNAAEAIFLIATFALGGGVLGTVMGWLQGLVLRRVAQPMGLWIASTALATSIMLVAVITDVLLFSDEFGIRAELLLSSMLILAETIGAVFMVPAVLCLRPR